jgi:hypothetical protein
VKRLTAWVVGFLVLGGAGVVAAADLPPLVKAATRISKDLAVLAVPPEAATFAAPAPTPDGFATIQPEVVGDWVTIDATAAGDPYALEAELITLGARDTAVAGRMVSARFPVASIPSLEGVTSLQFARQSLSRTNAGLVTSQGDHVMRADTARSTFGVDGSGVKVGLLSDSFNCLPGNGAATDVANKDLSTVDVVQVGGVPQESPDCVHLGTDEGRAMLQIVHDVAPGAALAFATAEGGQAHFANNIRALRDAGAKVIVDDIIYFAEPMFQDGVIAQAVDEVVGDGVAYFSSAGNNGRHGYDHAFVAGPFISGVGTLHNFGGTTMQTITMPPGSQFILVLQWDSPFFSVGGTGTQNDLDVYLLSSDGQSVIAPGVTDNLASGDPVEILGPIGCSGPSSCTGKIVVTNFAGPNPGRLKIGYLTNGFAISASPALTSGTIYGHANTNGAVAVGAAYYQTPTTLESYSSGGTTPVLFDTDGNRLALPDPRQFKPEIVAPDGVDTTFSGNDTDGDNFPNLFGTSAAAPHAAAVAALMLQAVPSATPDDIRHALDSTAKNMGPAGFDNNTGYGLIQADAALGALHVLSITSGPTATSQVLLPSGTTNLSVTANDSFGHTLTYGWTSTCTGGLPPGGFDDATSATPAWTAAANAISVTQTCTLKVTVSDGHGAAKSGTVAVSVLAPPHVTSFAPSPAPVGALVTIMGTNLTGVTGVTFAGPVPASPTLVTATSVKAVVPAGALTGVLSVTTPAGSAPSPSVFRVAPAMSGFSPGAAVGGSADVVTVNGTNLMAVTGTPTVKVGTTTVPPGLIQSNDGTTLTFTVPLGAQTGKITVTTADGTATSPTSLVVNQPPVAKSFSPNPAPIGATIKITGTNLLNVNQVTFSGAAPVAPEVAPPPTATSFTVVVPPDAQAGSVTVSGSDGASTSTTIFKIVPTITNFVPGSVEGGSATLVTVTGTHLLAPGTTTVKVGTTTVPPGLIQSNDGTTLTFTVPLGAQTGKITVTTAGGTATSATSLVVNQPPVAKSFSPNPAPIGATIKITGTNLPNVNQVTFSGAAPVAPEVAPPPTATSFTVVVPADAQAGPVTVSDGTNSSTSTAIFKILPVIANFAPGAAVGGSADVVTVNGTNLMAATGLPTVKVGTTTVPPGLIQSNDGTTLVFTVPLGATTGKISVTTTGGTGTSLTSLVVNQPPVAKSFSPNPAPIGATIKITGTNLLNVNQVTFSGAAPVAPEVAPPPTATSFTVVVPPDAQAGPVTVSDGTNSSTSTTIFKILPVITNFTSPASLGGSVVVTGTNLKSGSSDPVVKVGTVTAAFVASTPTSVTFTVPPLAVTGKISITTAGGTATTATSLIVMP